MNLAVRNALGAAGSAVPMIITVEDPEVVYESTTFCISRNANDFDGCPVVDSQYHIQDTSTLLDIIPPMIAGGARRLLFHGGQTWLAGWKITVNNAPGPIHIGSFGDGSATFVTDESTMFIAPTPTSDDWRFTDLVIDGSGNADGTGDEAFAPAGDRLLIYRVKGVDNTWDRTLVSGLQISSEIAMVDSDFVVPAFSAYGFFSRSAMMGNRAFGRVRVQHADGMVFSNSHIGNQASISEHTMMIRSLAFSEDQVPANPNRCPAGLVGADCARWTQKLVVSDNLIACAEWVCIQATVSGTDGWGAHGRDYVFERNFFYNSDTRPNVLSGTVALLWVQGVTVRNNVFNHNKTNPDLRVRAVGVSDPFREIEHAETKLIYYYGNSVFVPDDGYSSSQTGITLDALHPTYAVNNLMHTAKDISAIHIEDYGDPTRVEGDQTTNLFFPWDDNPFVAMGPDLPDLAYMDPQDYRLKHGNAAIDSGIEVPGWVVDFNLNVRDEQPDAGAFEFLAPLFADGFESGTTEAWSNGQP